MDLKRQKLTARLAAKGRNETDLQSPNVDRRTALGGLFSLGAAGMAGNANAQAATNTYVYADKESYSPGEKVVLRASAENSTQYPVDLKWKLRNATINDEQTSVVAQGSLRVLGHYPLVDALDQKWPVVEGVEITIPTQLKSGVYYFDLNKADLKTSGWTSAATTWIIVRETSANRAAILIVLPTFTIAAYNPFGGRSTYGFNSGSAGPAKTVSMLRPNGPSFSGNWYENLNALSKWMCSEFDCSFASDTDLQENPGLLAGKKCLALIGHDEYYTLQMRNNLQKYLGQGGNIANLGGNSCWWTIDYDRVNRTITHDKNDPTRWYWHLLGNSAKTLLGCGFENGGFNARKTAHLNATIYKAEHWLFDGSSAQNGQVFGRTQKMADYEVDGIHVEWVNGATGKVPRARAGTGTPASFEVLALADLTNVDWDKPGSPANWTIGVYQTQWSGRVFNCGTIQWGMAFVPGSTGALVDSAPIHLTRNFFKSCLAGSVLYEYSAAYPNSKSAPRATSLRRYRYSASPTPSANHVATSAALLLAKSTDSGAVPLYRHVSNNLIPNTQSRVALESLSTDAVRAGWMQAGQVGFAFKTASSNNRPVHVYFTQLPEGRVERLSLRHEAKLGESYEGIRFYVY